MNMMNKLSKGIVRCRHLILIVALALLVPSAILYLNTRVNYDMLSYLPQEIDSMRGQDILVDEFGTGAFSMIVIKDMPEKDVAALKEQLMTVEGVKDVLWYDSVLDLSVPMEMLPDEIYETFNSEDATMLFAVFSDTSGSDRTLNAIRTMRQMVSKQCFLSGMSAVLVDTQELSDAQAPIYVAIAVALSCLVLSLTMDSFLVPFLFLTSIAMAIVYNMGSNFFLGQVSYVTKALAAVLQLGVTMDYSIFLWHSYEAEKAKGGEKTDAMASAIRETFSSVVGSSITTVAGFVALCFMSFTIGLDLGIVMAKGVILGVISCVTILPSLILVFDKALAKTSHKPLIPEFKGIGAFVLKHYRLFLILFLIIMVPAVFGNNHVGVYYNLDSSLPKDLPSIEANETLQEEFHTGTTHLLMLDNELPEKEVKSLATEIKKLSGIKFVLGLNTIKGAGVPEEFIPERLTDALINDHWQLLLVGSEYAVASDEVNQQCDRISALIKRYDRNAMLVGEAPGTKDLITITDQDFATVSLVSIGVIFVIILLVFKSISLPAILVAVIEGGIFINMAVPYFTGTKLPFVASIVIGTIQLGATVDYAILMTTRYLRERTAGSDKKEAITVAVETSAKSIVVSALSFFAATFGVGLYSTIDMISSLCTLMSRGALISMVIVIFVLPSFLMLFDKVILKTTAGAHKKEKESIKEVLTHEV